MSNTAKYWIIILPRLVYVDGRGEGWEEELVVQS